MDAWLSQDELEQLTLELNPQLQLGTAKDVNWQRLQLEQSTPRPLYDTQRTVRTKSPTLLDFDTHQGFVYRRWDGAHWHTETRNLTAQTGYTTQQALLLDSLRTVLAVGDVDLDIEVYTPHKHEQLDTQYQLIKLNTEWMCVIGDSVYAESTRRTRDTRGYVEIAFSTRNEPVFTQHSLDTALDNLFK